MARSMAILLMLIFPAMGVGQPAAGCGQRNGVAEECASSVDDETQAVMSKSETSHGRGMLQRNAEAHDHSRVAQAHDEHLAQDQNRSLIPEIPWKEKVIPFVTGLVVDILHTIKVALKTVGGPNGGKYCSDEGEKKQVVCNREALGSWEIFKMVKLRQDGEHWGLMGGRYSTHPYWCADEGSKVVCDRSLPQEWENFHVVNKEEGKYSIRGGNKHKFCSSKSEKMTCNDQNMGDDGAETWEIMELEQTIPR